MNKILILTLIMLMLPISSALEQTIVTTHVKITYTIPPVNSTGHGTLVISGENLLKSYNLTANFEETLENNVYREYGNQSDLTKLFGMLENCSNFYQCQLDKGNLTWYIQTILQPKVDSYGNQTDYKSNYDICINDKSSLSSQIISKDSLIKDKEDEIKSNKWFYGIGGVIVGIFFITSILPWFRGRNTRISGGSMPNPTGQY